MHIRKERERKREKSLFVIIYYTYYLLVNGTFTTLFLWLPLWNLDGFLTAFVVGSSGRHSVYHLLLHQNGTYICLSIHPCPYKFFSLSFVPMCVAYAYAFTFLLLPFYYMHILTVFEEQKQVFFVEKMLSYLGTNIIMSLFVTSSVVLLLAEHNISLWNYGKPLQY